MKPYHYILLLLLFSGSLMGQTGGIRIKISKKPEVDTTTIYTQCLEKYVDYHYAKLSLENKLYLLGDSTKYNLPSSIRGIKILYLDAFEFQYILKNKRTLEYIKISTSWSKAHQNYTLMRRVIRIETFEGKYRLRLQKHKRYRTKFKKHYAAWFYCKYYTAEERFNLIFYKLN
ncbi:hypothetical protein [Lishizhenia tianjinensis]|nr:hypothetical protein [Lishizhenia tianjinensis]